MPQSTEQTPQNTSNVSGTMEAPAMPRGRQFAEQTTQHTSYRDEDNEGHERVRIPPSMLSAATAIHNIVNKRVRRPIDPDLRVGISIPESVINDALDAAGLAAVFLALVCMQRFQCRAVADEFKSELNKSRAAYCESLAEELVHTYADRGELFVWCLANKVCSPDAHFALSTND